MATPPYSVAVLAYSGSGDTASPVVTSTSPTYTLATPQSVTLAKVGGSLRVEWTYTPGDSDGLAGFKVWLSNNPTPTWGSAVDNGLSNGDGGTPTQAFYYQTTSSLKGPVYAIVQAYDADGGTAVSARVLLLINATLPATVAVDGISADTGRIATGLTANTIGSTAALDLNGVAVPTVDDLVAGTNITLNKTGRTVEIVASGGGGGSSNLTGAYDIEGDGSPVYTDLGLSEEFEGTSINANWTVSGGASATAVDPLAQISGMRYDLTTRAKGLLVQVDNTTQEFRMRGNVIGVNEQLIVSVSTPGLFTSTNYGFYINFSVSQNNTSPVSGNYIQAAIKTAGANMVLETGGTSLTAATLSSITTGGARVYLRLIRSATSTFHVLWSMDGTTWAHGGSTTVTSAGYIWVSVGANTYTRRTGQGDPIACINWIRHVAYTGLDPW